MSTLAGSRPPAPAPVAAPAKLDPGLAARLPMRVLVCDDNIINQKVALRLLQQMGYRADAVATGRAALEALDRQPYDLIFMDLQMPEMDGLEATRILRQRQQDISQFPNYRPPVIVVAMTASALKGDREKCLAAGMDDYIAKPVRLEDMRNIVERWGPRVQAARSVEPMKSHTPPAAGTSPPTCPPAAPVDLERLREFADGSEESLCELVGLFHKQTTEQLAQLAEALRAQNAPEVRRLAHSCAGASATCGAGELTRLLRQLEQQAEAGSLAQAPALLGQIRQEFARVCEFLAPHHRASDSLTRAS